MLKFATALALSLAVLAGPALAEPKHHGRDQNPGSERDLGDVLIDVATRALIREYFQTHPTAVPADNLPPGIRKNLGRGKPLPPGIAKKMPDGLHNRLAVRRGYDYRMVGADVLLVEAATGVIVDLVKDVLR